MHKPVCSLKLQQTHPCPSVYTAGDDSNTSLYCWMQRKVAVCSRASVCLHMLQHFIAGRFFVYYKKELRSFHSSAKNLSCSICVTSWNNHDPALHAQDAIQGFVSNLSKALDQGQLEKAVELAVEFLNTLPSHLAAINARRTIRDAIYIPDFLEKKLETIFILQKGFKVLQDVTTPDITNADLKALHEHRSVRYLEFSKVLAFWADLSEKLISMYECPYRDPSSAIKKIKAGIETFCGDSRGFSRGTFTELTMSLDKWQKQRNDRLKEDMYTNPEAAANFYGECLQDVLTKETILHFGLLLGLSFTEMDAGLYSGHPFDMTELIRMVLAKRDTADNRQLLQGFGHDVVSALCESGDERRAQICAKQWGYPAPERQPD